MKKIHFLIQTYTFLILLFGCNSQESSENFDIKGNWSAIEDSIYYEFYFSDDDTLEIFNQQWYFLPPHTYYVDNDSLIVQSSFGDSSTLRFKIHIIDSLNLELINSDYKTVLSRIPSNQFTIEKLLAENYLHLGFDNPLNDYLETKFVDSNFRIREFNFLIEHGIINKDSIINYWDKLVKDSSMFISDYKYLIDNLK